MTTEGIEVRSVGNTKVLHETALVEAFNLKAAIEYQLKNCKKTSYKPCDSFFIVYSWVMCQFYRFKWGSIVMPVF